MQTLSTTGSRRGALALVAGAVLLPALPASAQEVFDLNWHTVDCGGGVITGESWDLVATIAQPDAGFMGEGRSNGYTLSGGFWASSGGAACYANCDLSLTPPALNVADFSCFLHKYAAGDDYANCDGSQTDPVLNVADFTCFLQRFAAGCP
jgi:hypothetical protein